MSKVAVIAMTKVMAREEGCLMRVNSIDPGYCSTAQNAHQGTLPAEVGARIAAALVVLPPTNDFATGQHIRYDGSEVDWHSS